MSYSGEIWKVPAHCVYLTGGQGQCDTYLILDTSEGTITEFGHTGRGSDNTISYEEYDALPEAEKWKAHRKTPIREFFDTWAENYEKLVWMLVPNPIGEPATGRFYSHASTRHEEELLRLGALEPRHPQSIDTNPYDGGSEFDREQFEERIRSERHTANVYYTYLRHGWPRHFDTERYKIELFDKQQCKAELLDLEKRKDADMFRRMEEINPDAALFD